MKRIISALLILCLVCSFVPVIGASAEEAVSGEKSGITVVYDWASQMNGKGDNVSINNDAFLNEFTFDRSHNLWKYAGRKGWADYKWRGGDYIQLDRDGSGLWMTFEIYVPKNGAYTLEQGYTNLAGYAGTLGVYLIEKKDGAAFAESDMNADNRVLTLYCSGGTEGNYTKNAKTGTKDMNLKQGNYYVAYRQEDLSGRSIVLFGNLTLNGGSGKAVTEITEISAPTEVDKGATGTVTASVYYSDLTSGTATEGDVTYESNNPDVLEVNETTGAYTAKAGGTATVTVTAGLISKSVNVTVKNPEQSGVTVVYDWASQMNPGSDNGSLKTETFLSQFTFDRSHNLWKYDSQKSWTTVTWRSGDYIQFLRGGAGLYMAFEVYVPKTGTYTLEQKYATWGNNRGGSLGVYMIQKMDGAAFAEADMSDTNKVFTLDCTGTVNTYVAAEPAKVAKKLEQGYYYVAYQKTNAGTDGNGDITLFGNLTLNGGTDEVDKTDDVRYDAPTVDGLDIEGNLTEKEYNEETNTFTLTAEPEKNGSKFLYWAKGMSNNKKIISFSNKLENYMPEENGRNYLIAVYEGDVPAKAEYYNANGQLIATETQPTDYPSMAGYGKAYDWEEYGDAGIYVAKYAIEEPANNIGITVTGGEGSGIYAYGDTVTCTATPSADQTFKCWTKTLDNDKVEIVSVDATYTFKAWETCTVTAVYEYEYKGSAKKIILDSFSVTNGVIGVMAEFIGLDSTVEKGIMFVDEENNETKIAMTTPGKQFTIIADEAGIYKGYAIVKNGSGYELITDGSVTISDAE